MRCSDSKWDEEGEPQLQALIASAVRTTSRIVVRNTKDSTLRNILYDEIVRHRRRGAENLPSEGRRALGIREMDDDEIAADIAKAYGDNDSRECDEGGDFDEKHEILLARELLDLKEVLKCDLKPHGAVAN